MTVNRLNRAHKTIGADGSHLAQQQIINQAKSSPYDPLSQSALAHGYDKLVLRPSLGQWKTEPTRIPTLSRLSGSTSQHRHIDKKARSWRCSQSFVVWCGVT
jgi:hypothetical protein